MTPVGVPVTRASNGTFWGHPMAAGRRGLWFEDTPEAVAEMQQRLATRIGFDLECDVVDSDECAWNLMDILGFDGGAT